MLQSGVAVLLMAALSACAVGAQEPVVSGSPRPELAERAEVAAKNRSTKPSPGGDERSSGPQTSSEGAPAGGSASTGTEETHPNPDQEPGAVPADASWTVLARGADAAADHGGGPAYSDLSGLTVSESGDRLRLEVTVSGTVPARLQDGEVQGLGVDFYRSSSVESDYQVFLDGGRDGWRAYLQTPDGFVPFPGSFALDGGTFIVEIPWTAVGGRRPAQVSTFLDWSSGAAGHSADSASEVDLQPR